MEEMVKKVVEESRGASGWMKFLGVLQIIGGIIWILGALVSIFTTGPVWILFLAIAWIPLWMGVLLLHAGRYASASETNFENLHPMMYKLRRFFKVQGIFVIISLILGIIAVIIATSTGTGFVPRF